MIMCSAVQGLCLPPHTMPTSYGSYYECLLAGYEEATKKQKELGRKETNVHEIYIKFNCQWVKTNESNKEEKKLPVKFISG